MKTLFIIAFKFNRLPTASVDKADFDEDRKRNSRQKRRTGNENIGYIFLIGLNAIFETG